MASETQVYRLRSCETFGMATMIMVALIEQAASLGDGSP
jgi:hypothetical protein